MIEDQTIEPMEVVDLSQRTARAIGWLWPGVIPCDLLTNFQGDPGLGKGLVRADIEARVSTGRDFADCANPNPPGDVICLVAEDTIDSIILPRLIAAGADLNRIHIIALSGEGFSLREDLPRLSKTVEQYPQRRLVTIDPFSSFTGGVKTHVDGHVRPHIMTPLALMAEGTNVACICVHHLNKDQEKPDVHRAQGSIGITAAPRAVWQFKKDPDDPDRRLITPVKMNVAKDQSGLAYRIIATEVANVGEVPLIDWERQRIELEADQTGPREREQYRAERFLYETLTREGSMSQAAIKGRSADAGFAWRTIERAKKALLVESKQQRTDGRLSQSVWSLRPPVGGVAVRRNTPNNPDRQHPLIQNGHLCSPAMAALNGEVCP